MGAAIRVHTAGVIITDHRRHHLPEAAPIPGHQVRQAVVQEDQEVRAEDLVN